MTTSPQEPGDQPTPHDGGPAAYPAQPVAYLAYPAYPGSGHEAPYPAPPSRTGKAGLVITGVVGLLAGIGIGVGAMAIASGGGDPEPSADAAPVATTPPSGPRDQGGYSMNAVTNACDLIDPTLLHRWSSTPAGRPVNRESRPASLSCTVKYSTPSEAGTYQNNNAQIEFTAEFTDGPADAAYDSWKHHDTGTTGAGLASGEVTGIGDQGHWHSEVDEELRMQRYVVCVEDDNVVARVLIILWMADGEPLAGRADLDEVARSEIRMALDRLRA